MGLHVEEYEAAIPGTNANRAQQIVRAELCGGFCRNWIKSVEGRSAASMAALGPLLLVSLLLLLPTIRSDLGIRFSNVFGSHMVLQRNKPVPIWGSTYPGVTVTVTFDL